MPTKTESIKKFLQVKTHKDLGELYTHDMECQVNVGQDGGKRTEGEYLGRHWHGWTDGVQTWKPFRIPRNAATTPEYTDGVISWSLEQHAEGIGMTGWDWFKGLSRWVAYDFDAITGHSDKHKKKLTTEELEKIREALSKVPWVTLRRSTSGTGLHVYIFLEPVLTKNHTEHAALARAILSQLSAMTGADFESQVDTCFSGETECLTDKGVFSFRSIAGQKVRVLQKTPTGMAWVDAEIKSFGVQKVRPVHFGNGTTIWATEDHKWLTVDYKNRVNLFERKLTTQLTKNTRLPLADRILPEIDWRGYAHGFVFGDGYEVDYHGQIQTDVKLFGFKSELIGILSPFARSTGHKNGEEVVYGLPGDWKHLPVDCTPSYALGFILGLHAADGKLTNGGMAIHQASLQIAEKIRLLGIYAGLRMLQVRLDTPKSGRFNNGAPLYGITISPYNLPIDLIIRSDHKRHFVQTARKTTYVRVGKESRTEEVFCAVTPDYHNFTLGCDVVTSNCGGNMWVWHRKMAGTDGLELIKQGEILTEIPPYWKDHIKVITGHRKRNLPKFLTDSQTNGSDAERWFQDLTSQYPRLPLEDDHLRLIKWLQEKQTQSWWDQDHHMLVTHTFHLKEAHDDLKLRGLFETVAEGKEAGHDWNCYAFPLARGGWSVRRYSMGAQEKPSWDQDGRGWTRTYYNVNPDLNIAARCKGAIEDPSGGYVFTESELALEAAKLLGALVPDLPIGLRALKAKLKEHKDGRLLVEIEGDKNAVAAKDMPGWLHDKGKWRRLFPVKNLAPPETESMNHDDLIRHLVTDSGEDAGWSIKRGEKWDDEPLVHITKALESMNIIQKERQNIVGSAILRAWRLVNRPFQPEYPGDRLWNRGSAQFKVIPSQEERLHFPTWTMILHHIGRGLNDAIQHNPWAKANQIFTGADYLKIWIASLFKEPTEPLPYLFIYSKTQNNGKSTLHEALNLLMTRGYKRADIALTSQGSFNEELANAILCVVEELNLRRDKNAANRIKDWVTARELSIHAKGYTPYQAVNTTHWIQVANDVNYCPVFPGDTRITMILVPDLSPEIKIPKKKFMEQLQEEAPHFLAEILRVEIPPSNDRLNVPVIITAEKAEAERLNMTPVESFFQEKCHYVTGKTIKYGSLYEAFCQWADPSDAAYFTKQKFGRELPPQFPKGRLVSDGATFHVGNVSFDSMKPGDPVGPRLFASAPDDKGNVFLLPEGEKAKDGK